MAIRFDTLEDEQKYSEAISALHVIMSPLAEDVADMFVRADETANLDYAETLITRAVDLLYGAFMAVNAFSAMTNISTFSTSNGMYSSTNVRKVLLDAHSALVWCEVID